MSKNFDRISSLQESWKLETEDENSKSEFWQDLCDSLFRIVEGCLPNFEAFEALLKGLPGFKMVHLFDKGFT